MNTHQLAMWLLNLPDMPVALHAMGHTYLSEYHRDSHGPLQVGALHFATVGGALPHIVIGHMLEPGTYGNETVLALHEPPTHTPEGT